MLTDTGMLVPAPVIWVEGLIAVGKTTFARILAELLGFEFIEEPVDANFYLKDFYDEPEKWAYSMQIFLLHYRYNMKQRAAHSSMLSNHKGFVLDRCVAGDKVFAKLHWKDGNICDKDWKAYNYCYESMARTIQTPTLLLYLDAQPETCYQRMRDRDRAAERGVNLQYLQRLKAGYMEMLEDMRQGRTPWGRSMRIRIQGWDKIIEPGSPEWECTARSVLEECIAWR